MTVRVEERHTRILAAARHLALLQGLRGVTMEAIAREARIAKPTLYSHFASKEEIFVAVMEALIADMTEAFESALAAEGEIIDRVALALIGKHAAAMRLLEGSPHAEELYSAHDRVAGPQFRALEVLIETALTSELEAAGIAEPATAARLLMAVTHGVAINARSLPELEHGIRLITRRYLTPELQA